MDFQNEAQSFSNFSNKLVQLDLPAQSQMSDEADGTSLDPQTNTNEMNATETDELRDIQELFNEKYQVEIQRIQAIKQQQQQIQEFLSSNAHMKQFELDQINIRKYQEQAKQQKEQKTKKVYKAIYNHNKQLKDFEKDVLKLSKMSTKIQALAKSFKSGQNKDRKYKNQIADIVATQDQQRRTKNAETIGVDIGSNEDSVTNLGASPCSPMQRMFSQKCPSHIDMEGDGASQQLQLSKQPSFFNNASKLVGYNGLDVLKSHRSNICTNSQMLKNDSTKSKETKHYIKVLNYSNSANQKQNFKSFQNHQAHFTQLASANQTNSGSNLVMAELPENRLNNEGEETSYENLRLKKILEKSSNILSDEDLNSNLKNDQKIHLRIQNVNLKDQSPVDRNCMQMSNFMSIAGNSKNALNDIQNTNSNINGTLQNQNTGQSNCLYGGQPINIAQLCNNSSIYQSHVCNVTNRSPTAAGSQNQSNALLIKKHGFGGKKGKSHEGLRTGFITAQVPLDDKSRFSSGVPHNFQIYSARDQQKPSTFPKRMMSAAAAKEKIVIRASNNGSKTQRPQGTGGNYGLLKQFISVQDRFQRSPSETNENSTFTSTIQKMHMQIELMIKKLQANRQKLNVKLSKYQKRMKPVDDDVVRGSKTERTTRQGGQINVKKRGKPPQRTTRTGHQQYSDMSDESSEDFEHYSAAPMISEISKHQDLRLNRKESNIFIKSHIQDPQILSNPTLHLINDQLVLHNYYDNGSIPGTTPFLTIGDESCQRIEEEKFSGFLSNQRSTAPIEDHQPPARDQKKQNIFMGLAVKAQQKKQIVPRYTQSPIDQQKYIVSQNIFNQCIQDNADLSFNNSSSATFLNNNDEFQEVINQINDENIISNQKQVTAKKNMHDFYENMNRISPVLQSRDTDEANDDSQDEPQMPRMHEVYHNDNGDQLCQNIQQSYQARSRSKDMMFDNVQKQNSQNFQNLEEDDKQLILMTHTFENILESKQKNNILGSAEVKVIQNNNRDVQVKIPMLNLGKIVDSQQKEYYIMRQEDFNEPLLGSGITPEDGDDCLGITVTDDFLIDATGSAQSPLDALVDGLQQLAGSNQLDNESFKNETTIPLFITQDDQTNSYSKKRSRYILLKTDQKTKLGGARLSNINNAMPPKSKSMSRSNRKNIYRLIPSDQIGAYHGAYHNSIHQIMIQRFDGEKNQDSKSQSDEDDSRQIQNDSVNEEQQQVEIPKVILQKENNRLLLQDMQNVVIIQTNNSQQQSDALNAFNPMTMQSRNNENNNKNIGVVQPNPLQINKMNNKLFSFIDDKESKGSKEQQQNIKDLAAQFNQIAKIKANNQRDKKIQQQKMISQNIQQQTIDPETLYRGPLSPITFEGLQQEGQMRQLSHRDPNVSKEKPQELLINSQNIKEYKLLLLQYQQDQINRYNLVQKENQMQNMNVNQQKLKMRMQKASLKQNKLHINRNAAGEPDAQVIQPKKQSNTKTDNSSENGQEKKYVQKTQRLQQKHQRQNFANKQAKIKEEENKNKQIAQALIFSPNIPNSPSVGQMIQGREEKLAKTPQTASNKSIKQLQQQQNSQKGLLNRRKQQMSSNQLETAEPQPLSQRLVSNGQIANHQNSSHNGSSSQRGSKAHRSNSQHKIQSVESVPMMNKQQAEFKIKKRFLSQKRSDNVNSRSNKSIQRNSYNQQFGDRKMAKTWRNLQNQPGYVQLGGDFNFENDQETLNHQKNQKILKNNFVSCDQESQEKSNKGKEKVNKYQQARLQQPQLEKRKYDTNNAQNRPNANQDLRFDIDQVRPKIQNKNLRQKIDARRTILQNEIIEENASQESFPSGQAKQIPMPQPVQHIEKKRNLALLDFSNDLIQLNKQLLQKHLPQQNKNKDITETTSVDTYRKQHLKNTQKTVIQNINGNEYKYQTTNKIIKKMAKEFNTGIGAHGNLSFRKRYKVTEQAQPAAKRNDYNMFQTIDIANNSNILNNEKNQNTAGALYSQRAEALGSIKPVTNRQHRDYGDEAPSQSHASVVTSVGISNNGVQRTLQARAGLVAQPASKSLASNQSQSNGKIQIQKSNSKGKIQIRLNKQGNLLTSQHDSNKNSIDNEEVQPGQITKVQSQKIYKLKKQQIIISKANKHDQIQKNPQGNNLVYDPSYNEIIKSYNFQEIQQNNTD